MAFIEWSKNLSVNIAELDQQHKELVSMINEFHNAIAEQKSKDSIDTLISGLLDYTIGHFKTEEKYFIKFNYSGTADHMKEHRDLEKKVLDMKQKYENGRTLLTLEITGFLRKWLTEHIQKTDKKYSLFLKSKGL